MIATIAAGITIFAKSGNGVGEEVVGVTMIVVLTLDGTSTRCVVVSLARRGISVGVVGGVVDLRH